MKKLKANTYPRFGEDDENHNSVVDDDDASFVFLGEVWVFIKFWLSNFSALLSLEKFREDGNSIN